MAGHFEEVISVRIADLAQSVDARFDVVDTRFDAMDARFEAMDTELKTVAKFDEVRQAFLEQRHFTTFCFDKLGAELKAEIADVKVGLGRVERRLDRHEELLGEVLQDVRALKPR